MNKNDSEVTVRMRLLIFTTILQKNVKIAGIRQTPHRQTFLNIIDSLKKIFDELPDTKDMPDLETEEPAAKKESTRTRLKNTNTNANA